MANAEEILRGHVAVGGERVERSGRAGYLTRSSSVNASVHGMGSCFP